MPPHDQLWPSEELRALLRLRPTGHGRGPADAGGPCQAAGDGPLARLEARRVCRAEAVGGGRDACPVAPTSGTCLVVLRVAHRKRCFYPLRGGT